MARPHLRPHVPYYSEALHAGTAGRRLGALPRRAAAAYRARSITAMQTPSKTITPTSSARISQSCLRPGCSGTRSSPVAGEGSIARSRSMPWSFCALTAPRQGGGPRAIPGGSWARPDGHPIARGMTRAGARCASRPATQSSPSKVRWRYLRRHSWTRSPPGWTSLHHKRNGPGHLSRHDRNRDMRPISGDSIDTGLRLIGPHPSRGSCFPEPAPPRYVDGKRWDRSSCTAPLFRSVFEQVDRSSGHGRP
jgi:hypothetical protein